MTKRRKRTIEPLFNYNLGNVGSANMSGQVISPTNMQPLFHEILVTPSVMFSLDLMVSLRKVVKLLLHIDCFTIPLKAVWWRW